MKRVEVREFHDTDIPAITLFIEKHEQEILQEATQDWIKAEIKNLPFDDYTKETIRGCLLRACTIATVNI